MGYVIFDLDGTVIDSSHRHLAKPNGDVDLEHWFENAVPHKIAMDGLLPLARSMRAIYEAGHTVIVCTSRCMTEADVQFLSDNNLPYHELFSRQGRRVPKDHPDYPYSYYGFIGDARSDGVIKAEQLSDYFRSQGFASPAEAKAIMFDDNLGVIRAMKDIGIECLNAINVNRHMRSIAA